MTPDELFTEFLTDPQRGFRRRKFSAGLLVAFIDFLQELGVPGSGLESFEDFLDSYPRRMTAASGGQANTLIVEHDGRTLSLRPFYNEVERFFRAERKRFGYPSCAPHATQAWQDYLDWLDILVTFNATELAALRTRVCEHVLETLESHEFDSSTVVLDPPLFEMLLDGFDVIAHTGEPTGASFQGTVFGFIRADNPHLQIEVDKVRVGSKRLQRVGDIDGWDGPRLAISAEVKQYTLSLNDVADFEGFANECGRRGAIGIVAALDYEDGVRDALEALGLKTVDRSDLLHVVELWDPVKQRVAVSALLYYVSHVEKNAPLLSRLMEFLEDSADEFAAQFLPDESEGSE